MKLTYSAGTAMLALMLALGVSACGNSEQQESQTAQDTGSMDTGTTDSTTGDMTDTSMDNAGDRIAAVSGEAGRTWLAANAAKVGVQTTDSGLQYKVVSNGAEGGAAPDSDDVVVVHYTGTLIDGTKFDSSRDRGQPVDFPLNRVIPCWTEGLQMMHEGDRYELYCPSELAYGERGAGDDIPANAPLVFDVELIEVRSNDTGDSAGDADMPADNTDTATPDEDMSDEPMMDEEATTAPDEDTTTENPGTDEGTAEDPGQD